MHAEMGPQQEQFRDRRVTYFGRQVWYTAEGRNATRCSRRWQTSRPVPPPGEPDETLCLLSCLAHGDRPQPLSRRRNIVLNVDILASTGAKMLASTVDPEAKFEAKILRPREAPRKSSSATEVF